MDIDISKVMALVSIEDEKTKYLEDIKLILELFNKLDKYDSIVKEYEPLYHPLEQGGVLRKDRVVKSNIDIEDFSVTIKGGYVSLPPIRGVRKFKKS